MYNWINSLCDQSLERLSQDRQIQIDDSLRQRAIKNSVEMMRRKKLGFYLPAPLLESVQEVVTQIPAQDNIPQRLFSSWKRAFQGSNIESVGIGLAYDSQINVIYATACLRKRN